MSDAKFTPGPWGLDVGFDSSPGDFNKYWQVHDGHDAIACSANCSAGNREANAHLIAAAPELYEALCVCLEYITSAGDAAVVAKARAALAKARGETP